MAGGKGQQQQQQQQVEWDGGAPMTITLNAAPTVQGTPMAAGGVYEKVKAIEQQVTELAQYLQGKGMGMVDGMFDDEEDMGEHGPSSDLAIEPDAEDESGTQSQTAMGSGSGPAASDVAEAEPGNLMAKAAAAEEGKFKTDNSLKSTSPSSNASSPSASDAPEDEKSEKETALDEVSTECLKIAEDKRLGCC